jgi:L-rhamnose mutarotase
MPERSAFVLRVRPDKVDEYVEAHRRVWPEMLVALKEAGIRNYTIFRFGNEMFGYFEADDLDGAGRFLAAQKVCSRWQGRPATPRRGLPPRLAPSIGDFTDGRSSDGER